MEIIRLVFQNMKKRKGYQIIIFVLIFIASLLLTTSLSIYEHTNHLMDDTAQTLKTPQSEYFYLKNDYKDSYFDWFKANQNVTDVETTNALYFSDSILKDNKNGDYEFGYIYINEFQENQTIDHLKVIGDTVNSLNKGEIILPNIIKQTKGINVGDEITLTFNNQDYKFKVKGFVEDIMLGSSMTIAKQIWISPDDYENLFLPQANDNNQVTQLKVIYTNVNVCQQTENQFLETFNPHVIFSINYLLAKDTTMSVLNIILAIMIFFSIFLILIALMVIRYAILVSIEADYTEIGILKALGFSSQQIYLLTLLPYTILSLSATIISLGFAIFIIPTIGNLMLYSTGLLWKGSLSFLNSLLVLVIITGLIALYAYFLARKTKKISPIIAIRKGIVPLHFSSLLHFNMTKIKRIPVIFLLSLKQITTKLKQYLMLFLVTIILIFPIVFGGALVNLFQNPTKAMEILGLEPTDISFSVNTDVYDFNSVMNEVKDNEQIDHVIYINQTQIQIEDKKVDLFVSDDFDSLITSNIVSGRNPINQNEIAFTPTVLKSLHKNLGDFVTIKNSDNSTFRFIIVGLYQSVEAGGTTARISVAGMKNIESDFQLNGVYVYLKSGVKTDDVLNSLTHQFGDKLSLLVNQQKSMSNIFVPINHSISLIINILFVVSCIIVLLVTFLITNIIVFKETKEMGILKAIGLQSNQIRKQIIYRLLIITTFGVIIGIILTLLTSGPLFVLLLNQFGIAHLSLHYNVFMICIQSIVIIIVSLITSWLQTRFVKKISPYNLMNE